MIENFLVTVGITTYNSNIEFLSKAIDSATRQTYKNIEIIISDDGSNNVEEVKDLIKIKNDKRITLIRNVKNKGVASSLNNIVSLSKGTYFTWCPDDDYMDYSKIEIQVESLKFAPNSISICNHIQLLDAFSIKRSIKHNFYLKFTNIFLYLILLDRINGGSLMIPSNALKERNFNTSLKHVQDYDMWIHLFYNLSHVYVNKNLFFSRQHSHQSSQSDSITAKKEISKFYLNFFKKNLHNVIYYYGNRTYLFIIMLFKYRDITVVVDYCSKKENFQKYIGNFYRLDTYFYYLIDLFKLFGSVLLLFRRIKNFLMYKVLFRLLKKISLANKKNEKP